MLIPFSPYSPGLLPWNRRWGDAANSSCSQLPGPPDLRNRRVLAHQLGGSPGACLSAPANGLSVIHEGRFAQWDAAGSRLRLVDLETGLQIHAGDSLAAGRPTWGPGLWLTGGRCAFVSPRQIKVLDQDGALHVLTASTDASFHATGGLAASADGRLMVFAGAGDLHVLFHQDFLALRLSFRRDGAHAQAGPPLHPPTLYKDGRMVLQHELGCLCCSAMGEVEWWFPGGDLAHPPVLNRDEECGFVEASGRTVFVDRHGTPLSEMSEPLLLASRPRGGWIGLGQEALYALDRNYDLVWRLPLASAGLSPVVDGRGCVWAVAEGNNLLQISPQGNLVDSLALPARPGPLALVARGQLALDLDTAVWLLG